MGSTLFLFGLPGTFAFQGYYDTGDIGASWSGHANGTVTGSLAEVSTQFTWLTDDVCIIARLSDSFSGGGYGGPYNANEILVSPGPKGSTSYVIALSPVYFGGVSLTQDLEFDTEECLSGESTTPGTWDSHLAPDVIRGEIPAGQSSVSGHSNCSNSSTSTYGGITVSATECSLDWTISGIRSASSSGHPETSRPL